MKSDNCGSRLSKSGFDLPSALLLYAVTDRHWTSREKSLLEQTTDALRGGATMVQIREKD